jgi:hypothetical protein
VYVITATVTTSRAGMHVDAVCLQEALRLENVAGSDILAFLANQ